MAKRKKGETSDCKEEDNAKSIEHGEEDLSRSVLGGLKDPTTNSRISGDEEATDDDNTIHFKVPFNDKAIVCERRGSSDELSLIFTHGAGGGIANPATRTFAAGWAAVSPVVCFQGTMNLTSRVKTFQVVIEHEKAGAATALGGRSMGARAAVLTASERETKPDALILVSYPLTAAGKGRQPEQREKILTDLPGDIDVLFVVGSHDAQCDLKLLGEVRGKMKARSWMLEVRGADHSMSIKAKRGVEAMRLRSGSIAAEWLRERPVGKRYCAISWNHDDGEVASAGWESSDFDGSDEVKAKKRKTK